VKLKDILKETVGLYYDGEGKLKTLDKIKDIDAAIDYYNNVLIPRSKPSNKNSNYSDKREYFHFKNDLIKLKIYKQKK